MWTTILFAFAAILCVGSAILAVFAARIARHSTASLLSVQRSNASRLASVENSQLEFDETLKQLANRVKMQRVRTAINHVPDRDDFGDLSAKDQLRMKAGLIAGKPAKHQ